MQDAKPPKTIYGEKFFEEIAEGSLSSAQVIVPLLIKLLSPKSVMDVGCAEGAWLSVFKTNGINDHYGIDGTYVDRNRLVIDSKCFLATDLEKEFSLGRRFDLAICLEVGEHLPPATADKLVKSLTDHANCIVFSASVPFQDGTGHMNEQWPSYWAEKFRKAGYNAYDCIRSQVWNDKRVRWWFAQNIIVYATAQFAVENPALGKPTSNPLPLVHPQLLLHKQERLRQSQNEKEVEKDKANSLRWLLRQTYSTICARLKAK